MEKKEDAAAEAWGRREAAGVKQEGGAAREREGKVEVVDGAGVGCWWSGV